MPIPESWPPSANRPSTKRTPVQNAALAVGVVFLLIGVLSFLIEVSPRDDQLTLARHHCGAALLGVLPVSVLHDVVHVLFGMAGIASARAFSAARAYLIGGGLIYLLLLFGDEWLIDRASSLNVVPVTTADHWLHLGLGLGMLALGITWGRSTRRNIVA